jgi:hypothetical protein
MEHGQRHAAGWREWVALPALGVDRIKAKLDTGARSSAVHAWDIAPHAVDGETWVAFTLHPLQRNDRVRKECLARVVDRRYVTNSGGGRERRYVIETLLRIGELEWPIELTITNRDEMGFRMLIGRTAMTGRLIVDPSRSYLIGKRKRRRKHKAKAKRRPAT